MVDSFTSAEFRVGVNNYVNVFTQVRSLLLVLLLSRRPKPNSFKTEARIAGHFLFFSLDGQNVYEKEKKNTIHRNKEITIKQNIFLVISHLRVSLKNRDGINNRLF